MGSGDPGRLTQGFLMSKSRASCPAFCLPSLCPEPTLRGREDPTFSGVLGEAWGRGAWAAGPVIGRPREHPRPEAPPPAEQAGMPSTPLLVPSPPWPRCTEGGLVGQKYPQNTLSLNARQKAIRRGSVFSLVQAEQTQHFKRTENNSPVRFQTCVWSAS